MDKKDFEMLDDLIHLFQEYEQVDKTRLDAKAFKVHSTPTNYLRNKDMLRTLRRVKKYFTDREKMKEEAHRIFEAGYWNNVR